MAGLSLTLEELWFIQQLVRRTDHLGEPWDREDMRKVHAGILAQQAEYVLDLSEGFWWQVENQIPQTLDLGRSNLGRMILMKVFAVLSMEVEHEPVPAVFRDAGDYADDSPDSDAGTESTPRGNVPATADGTTASDSAGAVEKPTWD